MDLEMIRKVAAAKSILCGRHNHHASLMARSDDMA